MLRRAGYAAVLVAVGSLGMYAQAPAGDPAGQAAAGAPPAGPRRRPRRTADGLARGERRQVA